jgi:hypothetical protein
MGSDLFDLARRLMSGRGAENFSEYLRGLILLDAAHDSPDLIIGHDLPGWITRDGRFATAFSDHKLQRTVRELPGKEPLSSKKYRPEFPKAAALQGD